MLGMHLRLLDCRSRSGCKDPADLRAMTPSIALDRNLWRPLQDAAMFRHGDGN